MVMGPEPGIRMERMSSRLGTAHLRGLGHERREAVEVMAGIVGTGAALGMILHREGAQIRRLEALAAAVVEADVGDPDVSGQAAGVHGEAVIVGGDLHAASLLVAHGMVPAAVA